MSNKNPRGLFERPPGSGVWWINFYREGKQHREKVGRKSDAIKLYQVRKADAIAGRKLPELRNTKALTLSDLIDDALEFVADHKDKRNYISKAAIVKKDLGALPAADITPQQIDRWLSSHCKTPATTNRYKAFLSLCYREGIRNGKVNVNPARLVRHRREPAGRLRFLSRDEYNKLHEVISRRFPEHLAEFVVSVHSGMRLSEQYATTWNQVHLDRRLIRTNKAKNNRKVILGRTIHLNKDAIAAIAFGKLFWPTSECRNQQSNPSSIMGRNPAIRCFRVRGRRTDSIIDLGFCPAWRKPGLRTMFGTRTVTHSVRGWQWPEHR